jgi:hypothetical protein
MKAPEDLGNFISGKGVTETERLLARLAQRTFLSVWSYANVYRDQRASPTSIVGKELCDLLVIFRNHIVIFFQTSTVNSQRPLTVQWLG